MKKILVASLSVVSLLLSSCATSGWQTCEKCNGQGTWQQTSLHTGMVTTFKCTNCGGKGQVYYDATKDNVAAAVGAVGLLGGLIYLFSHSD